MVCCQSTVVSVVIGGLLCMGHCLTAASVGHCREPAAPNGTHVHGHGTAHTAPAKHASRVGARSCCGSNYSKLAKETLGEDRLLHPGERSAILHLDVPYSADVTVSYPHCGSCAHCSRHCHTNAPYAVRSRGRYRDLILQNVPMGRRHPVTVVAEWRGQTPKGKPSVTRKVHLMAGDRRWLTIRETDFEKKAPSSPAFVLLVSAAPKPPAGEDPEPPKTSKRPPCHRFTFEPVKLKATAAFPSSPQETTAAESFFFNPEQTPDLRFIHEPPDPTAIFTGTTHVKVTLRISGEGLDTPVKTTLTSVPLTFVYDTAKRYGYAELDFDAQGNSAPRERVEKAVLDRLTYNNTPSTMRMEAEIEIASLRFKVGRRLEITVHK